MKRIYVDRNYLIIADEDNLSKDIWTLSDNFYIEKNVEIITFYRKTDNYLILTIKFSDILDKNGVAYTSFNSFLNEISVHTEIRETDILNDAWGLPKFSLNRSIIHGLFTHDVPKTLWKETFNGVERTITNATSVNGKLRLVSGATLNNITILDSFRNPRYEPNRGLIYSISAFLPSKNALGERQWGIFTEESGVFFELNNGILSAVVRTKINGVVSDDKVTLSQSDFDLEKGNTYDIQMQWRGVGSVKFFINQKLIYTFDYLGKRTELITFNPANPIAFRCVNKGNNVVIECGCVDVSSEGGGVNGKTYGSIGTENTSGQIAINGFNVPIVAVRSKKTVNGKRNTRDTVALFANAYSDNKSLMRIWATRDWTAITPNQQTWKDFGDGHLEYIVYDIPDVTTPMTFDIAKAQLIFGCRVGQDTTFTTSALFDGLTDIHLTAGDMFVFTMHRENGISANVGVRFEFAEEI